jgi:hypothetical protein
MINKNCETRAILWVPETMHTSCDLLILVEQSAEPAWRASQIPAMLLDRLVLCALVRVHKCGSPRMPPVGAGRGRESAWWNRPGAAASR